MRRIDVAVIGGGPAGMSAAIAAAECGAHVVLLDEYARPGGQFFKHAGSEFSIGPRQLSREHPAGERLRVALKHERIEVWTASLVWGVFDSTLMLYRDGRSVAIEARAIVLATGAFDRPVAFPGWTLPGVMTAGGAQTLAKTQWVKPGHRMLISGAGPFLLPVSHQLLRAGVEIAAILEATSPAQWLRHAPALWGQWPRFAEAFDYWQALRRARVPVRYRSKIVRALGRDRVEAAVTTRVDENWRAIPGTEETIEVDAIATGYGLLPNTELAACCGCSMRWDSFAAAWFVDCDNDMRTSRPNIFAAGEIVGIGGAAIAIEEGRLAGTGAAAFVGAVSPQAAAERRRQPATQRHRLDQFAEMLNELFAPRLGLWEGLDDATLVCRCEEVMAGDIREAIRNGCGSPKEVKDWTRAGMGLCQGRICRGMVAQLIASERTQDVSAIPPAHIRPPIKPIPIAAMIHPEPENAGGP